MKLFKVVLCYFVVIAALCAATSSTYELTSHDVNAYHKLQRVFRSIHEEFKQNLETLQYFISTPSTEHLSMMDSSAKGLSVDPLKLPLAVADWLGFVESKKTELQSIIESNPKMLGRTAEIHTAFDYMVNRYYFFVRDAIHVAHHTVTDFLHTTRGKVSTNKDAYSLMVTESEDDLLSSFIVEGCEADQLMLLI